MYNVRWVRPVTCKRLIFLKHKRQTTKQKNNKHKTENLLFPEPPLAAETSAGRRGVRSKIYSYMILYIYIYIALPKASGPVRYIAMLRAVRRKNRRNKHIYIYIYTHMLYMLYVLYVYAYNNNDKPLLLLSSGVCVSGYRLATRVFVGIGDRKVASGWPKQKRFGDACTPRILAIWFWPVYPYRVGRRETRQSARRVRDCRASRELGTSAIDTGVCEKNTPFMRASALQASGRNCSPAPDLVFRKVIFPRASFSGGVFLNRHRYGVTALCTVRHVLQFALNGRRTNSTKSASISQQGF